MRTIIDLPDELASSLDRMKKESGRSRASLIREALEAYTRANATDEMQQGYGIWKARRKDGGHYQAEIRDEWNDR